MIVQWLVHVVVTLVQYSVTRSNFLSRTQVVVVVGGGGGGAVFITFSEISSYLLFTVHVILNFIFLPASCARTKTK